ncbi:hypothetical protein FB446DRAFT_744714 [Lentinula raphanica]|nr:hypothetical protein FB446DRAFT_744714 [Lentinula raphanica]
MLNLGDSPIHADVLVCILCAMPNFEDLHAIIRASKALYSAYSRHQAQILNAVAFNHVGRALPLALLLVRHNKHMSSEEYIAEIYGDESFTKWHFQVTPEDIRQLVSNAKIVAKWEDLYSFRKKDVHHQTSQLSPLQSWRFQKALYRLMLYSRLFPADKTVYALTDTSGINITVELEKERLLRSKFLLECFTNELSQLREVTGFVGEIITWIDRVDSFDRIASNKEFIDIALSVGPAAIFDCYEKLGFEPLTEAINEMCASTTPEYLEDVESRPFFSGYLSDPISKVHQARNDDESQYTPITIIENEPSIADSFPQCSQCGSRSVFIWGETTWDFLSLSSSILGIYLFSSQAQLLKGDLPRNPVELQRIEALLVKTPFKEIFEDIHSKKLKLPEWHDRNDDYWICNQCLVRFMKDHLHLWVIMKRKEANEQIAKDCWYGYNCRTQVHKLSHAQQLNHLCEPTR